MDASRAVAITPALTIHDGRLSEDCLELRFRRESRFIYSRSKARRLLVFAEVMRRTKNVPHHAGLVKR
jgi:hypothetical protein